MTFAIPELTTLFLLVFARVGTLVMLLPGFGEQAIPARMRLSLALLLTLVILPIVRPLFSGTLAGPALIATLIAEIVAGLILGLATRAILAALQTAGTVIAQQVGLSYAMTLDPTFSGQGAAIANFLSLLGVTLVFATDLHHLAIAAIGESYGVMPPGLMPDASDAARLGVGAVAHGFGLGIRISAPFVAFGILFNLGLGVLSRLMPQVQVFFLSLPLTILIGMLILFASLGLMMSVFLGDLGAFLRDPGVR